MLKRKRDVLYRTGIKGGSVNRGKSGERENTDEQENRHYAVIYTRKSSTHLPTGVGGDDDVPGVLFAVIAGAGGEEKKRERGKNGTISTSA